MTKLIIVIVLALTSTFANAQLKGSGKTVTKNYDYKNFDKLSFEGFNDDIQIEIGNTFKIEITSKEEYETNIQFKYNKEEGELILKVEPKTGKELYDETDAYKIKIILPEISVIKNFGNSDVAINGIVGRYFRAESNSNGSVICQGAIDFLDIDKIGDGNVDAKNLIAKKAKIRNYGNGDVAVNVSEELTAKATGNGRTINYGKARFDSQSSKSGDADFINKF